MGATRTASLNLEFSEWLEQVWELSGGNPELSRGELRCMFDRGRTSQEAADYSLKVRSLRHFTRNVGLCGCDLCSEFNRRLDAGERLF